MLTSTLAMYIPDTIVAPATAPGVGAVAIIRLSGPRAFEILDAIWHPARAGHPRELVLGDVIDAATRAHLDRAMAVRFPGPRSFTGEDVAELHCHGGAYLTRRIIAAAVAHGARMAEHGEFTRRAFLNGRMDLAEAEAVADLISARSESSLRQALAQLSGELSKKVNELRNKVIAIRAHLEVEIDFSDEDIVIPARSAMIRDLDNVIGDVAILLDSFSRGKLVRHGVRAAIIGKPNVGKSSLLNLMLGTDRAIVTAIPGTTRDVIEDTVALGGFAMTLLDTAGIRAGRDELERLGIARTRAVAAAADLLIAVFDSSRALDAEDFAIVGLCAERPGLAILNKADLPKVADVLALRAAGIAMPALEISALTGDGLAALRDELTRAVAAIVAPDGASGLAISRERHRAALARALTALRAARESIAARMPPEITAVDAMAACDALGAITGAVTGEDVLDAVFREFCIGK
ncbi:MAG TPA: tRNA uridine-5-carboxymethylaminomethyl(34) synthesis GTPase MnmE [Candidatus Binataceae bacterium]|nr:tRNA uridine-5-carboxymethylaminomethyl(34) synthesis GTPase MnmE [Candidatus Binataceae bacterium]